MKVLHRIAKAYEVVERDTEVDFDEVALRLPKSTLTLDIHDKSFCNAWELYLDENPIFIWGAWLLAGYS